MASNGAPFSEEMAAAKPYARVYALAVYEALLFKMAEKAESDVSSRRSLTGGFVALPA